MLIIDDKEYRDIVNPILMDNDFRKTYNIEHHGISRMEHLLKISYKSYQIAKKLGLNYVAVARGGLLHDFYLDGNERSSLKKFSDTFIHPRKALNTSSSHFDLTDMEKNIIVSHMFPLYLSMPKYKESVLVNLVDKVIGSYEMAKEVKYKTSYKFNYTFLLLMLFITRN